MKKTNFWLKGPVYDLFWFYPFLWAAPLVILTYKFNINLLYVAGPLILVHSRMHLCLPIYFGLFVSDDISKNRDNIIWKNMLIFLTVFPIVFLIGFQYKFFLTSVLPSVMVLWAVWHFYLQERGMLSLYRSRTGANQPLQIKMDRLICVVFCLVNPIQYWFREGLRLKWIEAFIDPSQFDRILPWWSVHTACIALFVLYILVQLKFKQVKTPRMLYACMLFGQYLILSNVFSWPIYFGWMIRVFSHNSAEIGLQIQMWKNESQIKKIKSQFYFAAVFLLIVVPTHIFAVLLFPFIRYIHEPGYFDWDKFLAYDRPVLIGFTIFYFALINFAHYIVGGHVYNFKNAHVRKILSFPSGNHTLLSQEQKVLSGQKKVAG